MMRRPIFQLDAFTTRRFAGNPAAVIVMPSFPEDAVMQAIAAENNLSETAFLVPEGGDYRLRWFTPVTEKSQQLPTSRFSKSKPSLPAPIIKI